MVRCRHECRICLLNLRDCASIYRQLREEGYGAELDWLEDRSYEKKSLEEMHEFRKNQHFTPRGQYSSVLTRESCAV